MKSNPSPATSAASPAATAASPPVITSVSATKVAAEVSLQTLVAGLPVVFAGEATFVLPSGTYTFAQLTAPLQKGIAAAEATKAAASQYHDAVAAEKPVAEAAEGIRKEVKALAVARFGAESNVLSQLGYEPAKPRQISAATKAASAAKALATRKAKKASPPPAPKPAG